MTKQNNGGLEATSVYVFLTAVAAVLVILSGLMLSIVFADTSFEERHILLDEETGCEYITVSYRGGVTPRLGPDGKQICHQQRKGE